MNIEFKDYIIRLIFKFLNQYIGILDFIIIKYLYINNNQNEEK